jgi:hypothetical protein
MSDSLDLYPKKKKEPPSERVFDIRISEKGGQVISILVPLSPNQILSDPEVAKEELLQAFNKLVQKLIV